MNRLNVLHFNARVELGSVVAEAAEVQAKSRTSRLLSPSVSAYAGLAGFVCCAAAVIIAASLLALQIH